MYGTLLIALALTGSSLLGPTDARASSPERAAEFPARYASAEAPAGRPINRAWWSEFGDPELSRLVGRGLEQNLEVKSAQSRIDEADAVVAERLAPLLPTVTWDTQSQLAPSDTLGFQFGGLPTAMGASRPGNVYLTWSSALSVRLDIDIAAKNIERRRAARHERAASFADLDHQRALLAGQIVEAYYDVVAAKQTLAAIRRQISTAQTLLEIIEVHFAAGQANAVEVFQQQQQVAAATARQPLAEAPVDVYQQRLAVLLGEHPGTEFRTPARLPAIGRSVGVGAPADLLANHPELRAATERWATRRARRKAANREFAPTLALTGAAGYQGFYFDSGLPGAEPHRHQRLWNVGVVLSVPLFDGGRSIAGAKEARAAENTARLELQQSSLAAVRDVEEALVRDRAHRKALEAWERNVHAAAAAYEEARRRYVEGIGDYTVVLAASDAVRAAELNLITARHDLISNRVLLHVALGDGGNT